MHFEQTVPLPLDEVFAFFSDPENLPKLTPPWVGFKILTPSPISMHEGTLIEYRVRVRGIPMLWSSQICEWNPPNHFADIQLKGPYAFWRHKHSFKTVPAGTLVSDDIEYAVPFSWMIGLGLVDRLFVRPEINRIFAHRHQALSAILGFNAGENQRN